MRDVLLPSNKSGYPDLNAYNVYNHAGGWILLFCTEHGDLQDPFSYLTVPPAKMPFLHRQSAYKQVKLLNHPIDAVFIAAERLSRGSHFHVEAHNTNAICAVHKTPCGAFTLISNVLKATMTFPFVEAVEYYVLEKTSFPLYGSIWHAEGIPDVPLYQRMGKHKKAQAAFEKQLH